MKNTITIILSLFFLFSARAQEETETLSNIKTFTPSKLLQKGQVDVKWFNNFYTQTKSTFSDGTEPRVNFYTSSFEFLTGVSQNARINVGLVINVRSSTFSSPGDDKGWFSTLGFENNDIDARSGISSIAPTISIQPFKNISNFSFRTSFYIPLVKDSETPIFLDKNSYVWENKFFYDYTFPSGKFQLFTELDTQLNFGEKEKGFSNNSLGLPASVFVSYFPSDVFTFYLQTQQYFLVDLGNDFSQEYTQLGVGTKYQVNDAINLEFSYTNFVRGTDTGLGQTLNFGLRYIFK